MFHRFYGGKTTVARFGKSKSFAQRRVPDNQSPHSPYYENYISPNVRLAFLAPNPDFGALFEGPLHGFCLARDSGSWRIKVDILLTKISLAIRLLYGWEHEEWCASDVSSDWWCVCVCVHVGSGCPAFELLTGGSGIPEDEHRDRLTSFRV